MKSKLSLTFATCLVLSGLLVVNMASAQAPDKVRYISSATRIINNIASKVTISCNIDPQEKPIYSGRLTSIDAPQQVQPNELFNITVKIQNTGNMPWLGTSSGCSNVLNPVYLGTTRDQDRVSAFHAPAVFGNTSWLGANRIKMKTGRVNPGELAEFTFVAHAPVDPGIYREYFAPVVEGKTWVKEDAELSFDIKVGEPQVSEDIYNITKDIPASLNLIDPKFGDKSINVDLSEQKMYIKLGDVVIKSFRVSTGKAATPTPSGNFSIQFKQEVRVASSKPHYIMPKFMQFKKGGYGIHALPSLANDRGVFWREALNHIGSPRSHGCIRLLPEDAEFTFNFADVGTPVKVAW